MLHLLFIRYKFLKAWPPEHQAFFYYENPSIISIPAFAVFINWK